MKYALLIIVLYTTKAILCIECPPGCLSCSSTQVCTVCKEVYDLRKHQCYFNCPLQCASCKHGTCEVCRDGYYGTLCEHQCDSDCLDERCDKNTGVCSKGEQDKTTDECPEKCDTCDATNECMSCKKGYWGVDCHHECHGKCQLNTCDKSTGWCAQVYTTITTNASVSEATEPCQRGHYGEGCDNDCPENCLNSVCFRNGTCVSDCVHGYFGEMCNRNCNCKVGCHRLVGTCLDNCSNGKDGDGCTQDFATSDESNDNDDSSTKIIIGVAVGSCGVAIVTIVVVVILVLRMRLRRVRESGP